MRATAPMRADSMHRGLCCRKQRSNTRRTMRRTVPCKAASVCWQPRRRLGTDSTRCRTGRRSRRSRARVGAESVEIPASGAIIFHVMVLVVP